MILKRIFQRNEDRLNGLIHPSLQWMHLPALGIKSIFAGLHGSGVWVSFMGHPLKIAIINGVIAFSVFCNMTGMIPSAPKLKGLKRVHPI